MSAEKNMIYILYCLFHIRTYNINMIYNTDPIYFIFVRPFFDCFNITSFRGSAPRCRTYVCLSHVIFRPRAFFTSVISDGQKNNHDKKLTAIEFEFTS